MRKGVTLYRCVWEDFPPDVVWYEIKDNIDGTIAYEQYMEQLAKDESDEAAVAQCPAPHTSTLGHSGPLWGTLRGVCAEAPWGGPLSHVSLGDQWGHFSE